MDSVNKNHRSVVLLVTAAASALLLWDLGALSQFTRAEVYFAETAREMLVSGDWITPRFCEQIFFDKPPGTYWLIALSFKLLGLTESAARLPSALGGILTVALTAFFASRHYGKRAGVIAGLALLTSFGFWSFARYAMSDALLTLFVAAAMFSYIEALGPTPHWRWLVVAGHASTAIALNIKGPVAPVLATLAIGSCVLIFRHREWKRLFYPPALLVLFAIGVPWYIAILYIHRSTFFDSFLVTENLSRFFGGKYANHQPVTYYLGVILGLFFPWSLWLPSSAALLLKQDSPDPARRITWFLIFWAATTAGFFTLSGCKLDYYLLPAFPAMAVLAGAGLSKLSSDPSVFSGSRRIFTAFTAASFAVISFAFFKNSRILFPDLGVYTHFGISLATILGAVLIICTLPSRNGKALPFLMVITMASVFVLLNQLQLPALTRYQTIPRFARNIARADYNQQYRVGAGFELAIWHPDVRFYTGLPVEPLENQPAAENFVNAPGPALLMLPEEDLDDVFANSNRTYQILDRGPYLGHAVPGLAFFRAPKPTTVILVEVQNQKNYASLNAHHHLKIR